MELGAQCVAIDATLEPLLQPAAPLTEYAWRYRYPGEPDTPTEAVVREALGRARSAVAAILDRLPPDTHP